MVRRLSAAARVLGDEDVAVEDAHPVLVRAQAQRLADERVRDRVVVAVEAQVGLLAAADGLDALGARRMLGQGQEPGALELEVLLHGAPLGVGRVHARVGAVPRASGRAGG